MEAAFSSQPNLWRPRLLGKSVKIGVACLAIVVGLHVASEIERQDGPVYSLLIGKKTLSQINGTLDGTVIDTSGTRGGRTYAEYQAARTSHPAGTYAGFVCAWSCDGHEAGNDWAADHGLTDPGKCHGNSWAFTEGCVAYVRDNQPEGPQRDGDGPSIF